VRACVCLARFNPVALIHSLSLRDTRYKCTRRSASAPARGQRLLMLVPGSTTYAAPVLIVHRSRVQWPQAAGTLPRPSPPSIKSLQLCRAQRSTGASESAPAAVCKRGVAWQRLNMLCSARDTVRCTRCRRSPAASQGHEHRYTFALRHKVAKSTGHWTAVDPASKRQDSSDS
jgi:hypothetical protein